MLNENIVSLLIPCYNGEQFVERCLINVLEQEYAQYIELILVNDGSTDKTEEIIFQLQKRLDNELWRFCYIKQDDKQWKRNADECTRLGIPFGVYIYSYATSDAQAKSEAEHVLRMVSGYKLSYPIYLDLEQAGTENGAIQRANIFGDIIEKAGYWCGVYANTNWWTNYLAKFDYISNLADFQAFYNILGIFIG